MKKHCVVSLSGGMDSSTLLLRAISEYDTVTGISFDYGQKHRVELERAQSLIDYLANNNHNVTYKQIKLDGLVDLLNSALVEGGDEVPEGHYEQDNMKETVVPNRNKMFSSIVQAVALSIANETGEQTDIALGIHAGDHAIYPDCRQEFRDADDEAFRMGNWDHERVGYFTPYLDTDKYGILQNGEYLCGVLDIEFDEVYKRTNTSYKPIKHYYRPETNAYKWYSDYKSASSVERIEAFLKLGRPDPVEYADESGPVEWKVASEHVNKLLENWNG
jgi:7-cyano-7-deazaguanine synthase|tara:strand:- start:2060 stop:2884 length:825 start_codon:yes stop_codon:yes gene_type:complete